MVKAYPKEIHPKKINQIIYLTRVFAHIDLISNKLEEYSMYDIENRSILMKMLIPNDCDSQLVADVYQSYIGAKIIGAINDDASSDDESSDDESSDDESSDDE